MAPAPLLIISKARCFISCECQISAIYIPQLLRASEWLLILPEINGRGRVELKTKGQKGVSGGGGGGDIEETKKIKGAEKAQTTNHNLIGFL